MEFWIMNDILKATGSPYRIIFDPRLNLGMSDYVLTLDNKPIASNEDPRRLWQSLHNFCVPHTTLM